MEHKSSAIMITKCWPAEKKGLQKRIDGKMVPLPKVFAWLLPDYSTPERPQQCNVFANRLFLVSKKGYALSLGCCILLFYSPSVEVRGVHLPEPRLSPSIIIASISTSPTAFSTEPVPAFVGCDKENNIYIYIYFKTCNKYKRLRNGAEKWHSVHVFKKALLAC